MSTSAADINYGDKGEQLRTHPLPRYTPPSRGAESSLITPSIATLTGTGRPRRWRPQPQDHDAGAEQPPGPVSLEELQRRADIMFSGATGEAVASGDLGITSAPSYQLVKDVHTVLEALPPALFDKDVKDRPCGLLDKYGAAGMLIGDVLGLPFIPWILAEPIGK